MHCACDERYQYRLYSNESITDPFEYDSDLANDSALPSDILFLSQISYLFEDGQHRIGQLYRQDLLRRIENEVFRIETAKGLHEMVLGWQVPASPISEAGARSRQCSLLLNGRDARGVADALEMIFLWKCQCQFSGM